MSRDQPRISDSYRFLFKKLGILNFGFLIKELADFLLNRKVVEFSQNKHF